jgi:hypothetical protein
MSVEDIRRVEFGGMTTGTIARRADSAPLLRSHDQLSERGPSGEFGFPAGQGVGGEDECAAVGHRVDFAAVDVGVEDAAVHGRMREEGFHFLHDHLLEKYPLASTVMVEPQNFLDPPPVGWDRAASLTAHLAGGFVRIEAPHAVQSVAQELRCQFSRSNLTYPDGPVESDMPVPSGIFKVFRSHKQS